MLLDQISFLLLVKKIFQLLIFFCAFSLAFPRFCGSSVTDFGHLRTKLACFHLCTISFLLMTIWLANVITWLGLFVSMGHRHGILPFLAVENLISFSHSSNYCTLMAVVCWLKFLFAEVISVDWFSRRPLETFRIPRI